jgi:hypothetical protein
MPYILGRKKYIMSKSLDMQNKQSSCSTNTMPNNVTK